MVELRKRKPAAEASSPPPAKKSSNPIKKAVDAAKEAITGSSATTNGASAKIAVGQTIPLEGFGGDLETHSGEKVTLQQLVEKSQSGVVLFTYPKANTPGCKSNMWGPLLRLNAQARHALQGSAKEPEPRSFPFDALLTLVQARPKHAFSVTTTHQSLVMAS